MLLNQYPHRHTSTQTVYDKVSMGYEDTPGDVIVNNMAVEKVTVEDEVTPAMDVETMTQATNPSIARGPEYPSDCYT